jgi:hypothetical protein
VPSAGSTSCGGCCAGAGDVLNTLVLPAFLGFVVCEIRANTRAAFLFSE